MRTHVALLRGINLGGRNRVAMADLREIVASLGHRDVATYIQSGNVVFDAGDADPGAVGGELEAALAERLGLRLLVVVLTRDELASVVLADPFPGESNPKWVHAFFRRAPLTAEEARDLGTALDTARERGGGEEVRVLDRAIVLHTPVGLAGSEVAVHLSRPALRTTARNWATVLRVHALLAEQRG